MSGDPWGWAPYHYGNWYMSSFGWAWYPGSIYGRHYWRPAMVSFFGWGSPGIGVGFGVGFGFGNVGWVPLAPFERFRPWYGRGFNNTTIVNNVRVTNNFRNARFVNGRNGVTSINANDFGRGRSINSNNFVRASNTDLARAGSVQGRLPFTASADARRMSDARVNTQSMPRVNANTRFAQRRWSNRSSSDFRQIRADVRAALEQFFAGSDRRRKQQWKRGRIPALRERRCARQPATQRNQFERKRGQRSREKQFEQRWLADVRGQQLAGGDRRGSEQWAHGALDGWPGSNSDSARSAGSQFFATKPAAAGSS